MIHIGLQDKTRTEVCRILSTLLADEFVLVARTKNYHRNATGPHFLEFHVRGSVPAVGRTDRPHRRAYSCFGGKSRWLAYRISEVLAAPELPGVHLTSPAMVEGLLDDHELRDPRPPRRSGAKRGTATRHCHDGFSDVSPPVRCPFCDNNLSYLAEVLASTTTGTQCPKCGIVYQPWLGLRIPTTQVTCLPAKASFLHVWTYAVSGNHLRPRRQTPERSPLSAGRPTGSTG